LFPIPQKHDPPESSQTRPDKPRIAKSNLELLVEVLTSVGFWGGLSALVALVSLALPWWGITVQPSTLNTFWGLLFGPQSQPANVTFFPDKLNAALAANGSVMTGLVLLASLSTIIGTLLKRTLILTTSLTLSIITVVSFFADVGNAVGNECTGAGLPQDYSCINTIVGQGSSGASLMTWGFQAGFYTFIGSTTLLLGTLVLQRNKQ
jgi:hypothetical protein